MDTKQFWSQRPKPLTSFITEEVVIQRKNKEYCICLDIEQLYFLRHFMLIGSFSYAQRLVKWSFSGSKAAHTLEGGTTSNDSITIMKNLLCQLATEPNVCFAKLILMYLCTILKETVEQVESKKMLQLP